MGPPAQENGRFGGQIAVKSLALNYQTANTKEKLGGLVRAISSFAKFLWLLLTYF